MDDKLNKDNNLQNKNAQYKLLINGLVYLNH